jgi:hypothetical protein
VNVVALFSGRLKADTVVLSYLIRRYNLRPEDIVRCRRVKVEILNFGSSWK